MSVASIKKVAEIVAEIANASAEQATGIEQVGKALTQTDEATQQNSALVEENAATAKTLENQALAMDQRVAFFRIDEGQGSRSAPHAVRSRRRGQFGAALAGILNRRRTTCAKPSVYGEGDCSESSLRRTRANNPAVYLISP